MKPQPKFLRQIDTGRIYPFSEFIANRADMELCHEEEIESALLQNKALGITREESAGDTPKPTREELIKAAVAKIPPEHYGKGPAGNFPRVADVAALTGFPVSAKEIKAALASE